MTFGQFMPVFDLFLLLEAYEWKLLQTSGDPIEARRGHSGTIVGKHMIIFGGINSKGKYLDDLYHMDLSNIHFFLI
jgi:hypothetical protein